MKTLRFISTAGLFLFLSAGVLHAQQKANLGDNAALRYWSAFAEMQDAAVSDKDANELKLIVEGTAPYEDLKYRELVEKNRFALKTMARGTTLKRCDWGLDYELGPETPVDYVRKSLALGRLNVLYALHLLIAGDKEGAVQTVAAGLRFSHDVANDGTLFATISSKSLLVAHLSIITFAAHSQGLSGAQRSLLQDTLAQFGRDGLDWRAAMKRELALLPPAGADPESLSAMARITPAYLKIFDNPASLPELQRTLAAAPRSLQELVPNPKRVLEYRQDLSDKLQQTRALLQ
jgi:hypothetical protein